MRSAFTLGAPRAGRQRGGKHAENDVRLNYYMTESPATMHGCGLTDRTGRSARISAIRPANTVSENNRR